MLTNEKATMIADYFKADAQRTKALIEMTAEEAAAKMTADGCAVTVEELNEIGDSLKTTFTPASDELNEEALQDVAGGFAAAAAATVTVGAIVACGVGGFVCGVVANAKWKW